MRRHRGHYYTERAATARAWREVGELPEYARKLVAYCGANTRYKDGKSRVYVPYISLTPTPGSPANVEQMSALRAKFAKVGVDVLFRVGFAEQSDAQAYAERVVVEMGSVNHGDHRVKSAKAGTEPLSRLIGLHKTMSEQARERYAHIPTVTVEGTGTDSWQFWHGWCRDRGLDCSFLDRELSRRISKAIFG